MIRTRFWVPFEILTIAQENKYLCIFQGNFRIYHVSVCCVYSLESPLRGDSNEYTQHTIIEDGNDIPKFSPYASWPGVLINPQWLELPISRTNFYGPNDDRAIEIRL